jgi:hypothetical protein
MKKCIKVVRGKMKYFLGDKEVTAQEFTGSFVTKPLDVAEDAVEHHTAGFTGYPIQSLALAVSSKQVKEAQEDSVKKGVPTQFTKSGRPILRDAAHRKAYLRAYGYHDRNSFTGY